MSKPVVVYSEDTAVTRQRGEMSLKNAGYEVYAYPQADQALEKIKELVTAGITPIVVTDGLMPPGMDGVQLLKNLPKNLPSLMISGEQGLESWLEGGGVTVDQIIKKPFDWDKDGVSAVNRLRDKYLQTGSMGEAGPTPKNPASYSR